MIAIPYFDSSSICPSHPNSFDDERNDIVPFAVQIEPARHNSAVQECHLWQQVLCGALTPCTFHHEYCYFASTSSIGGEIVRFAAGRKWEVDASLYITTLIMDRILSVWWKETMKLLPIQKMYRDLMACTLRCYESYDEKARKLNIQN